MISANQSKLQFSLRSTEDIFSVMARFHPQGKTVLNRTEWRGKPPRTCGLTNVKVRSFSAGSTEPKTFDVEVTYRPKGCITFVGQTKYDGWTAMVLDRKNDGTLLDGHGNPLPEGHSPVYLPFELYHDIEFNEIDFGEFIGESDVENTAHLAREDVLREISSSGHFAASSQSEFIAPRRHRPLVKIVLSNAPSSVGTDGFGTRIINVNNFTPHLQQVLLDEFTELVSGFVEGRYSIQSISNAECVFVELSDILVDCTPNEEGKPSRFNCFKEYVSETFLDDLAIRLMATYEVHVSIVDGPDGGLLLRAISQPKSR